MSKDRPSSTPVPGSVTNASTPRCEGTGTSLTTGRLDESPTLWTAWLDYYATGEGRILMACITYANCGDQIRARFAERFDPWYARGCEVQRGVVRNELTRLLWSGEALDMIERLAARGAVIDVHSWLAWNFS